MIVKLIANSWSREAHGQYAEALSVGLGHALQQPDHYLTFSI